MPQKKPLLLLGILLLACQAQTSELTHAPIPTPSPSLPSPTPPFSDDLIQLANEYKALRDIPGQFGGSEWVAEVDQWQGSKHQAMLTLGEQLGDGEYGRSQLTTLLGPANHVVTGGDALFELIQSLPEYETFAQSDEFLVYEWRRTHDFLFFAIQQDRIIGSGWWHAGE